METFADNGCIQVHVKFYTDLLILALVMIAHCNMNFLNQKYFKYVHEDVDGGVWGCPSRYINFVIFS